MADSVMFVHHPPDAVAVHDCRGVGVRLGCKSCRVQAEEAFVLLCFVQLGPLFGSCFVHIPLALHTEPGRLCTQLAWQLKKRTALLLLQPQVVLTPCPWLVHECGVYVFARNYNFCQTQWFWPAHHSSTGPSWHEWAAVAWVCLISILCDM